MKGEQLNKEGKKNHLDIALRQSTHLKRMAEELFELAHLEARDAHPQTEPCALAELLQDITQKFQLRAAEAGMELLLEPPKSTPMAIADVALTERVLDNLIGNAIDHTPPGGSVSLGLSADGEALTLSITDSGPGIPAEDLAHLFEPFYRGKQQGSDNRHAGLGLAIAKRIIDLQGGKLWVKNNRTGGAIFSFTLPRA